MLGALDAITNVLAQALVTGILVAWANYKLFIHRLTEIEQRIEPLDRADNSVFTRLASLEEARRAQRRK